MDLVFYCDGNSDLGFGHVARCISLAQTVEQNCAECRILFCGHYSDAVSARIAEKLPGAAFEAGGMFPAARVAVIDRMANTADPSDWDENFLNNACAASGSVIYIASGIRVPAPRSNMISVGYQPFAAIAARPDLHWGLEFAPVPPGFQTVCAAARQPDRAFVGIGGGGSAQSLSVILEALDGVDGIRRIDVLVSPVAEYGADAPITGKPVSFHSNIPSLAPLLARAGLVVASLGNLMIEALSLGAPVCVVGQKAFQVEYGKQFETLGLAVSGGILGQVTPRALSAAFEQTLANADRLSANARAQIDDNGLVRIAELIEVRLSYGSGHPS